MGWVSKGKNEGQEREIWVETSMSEKGYEEKLLNQKILFAESLISSKNWTWWNRSR